MRSLKDLSDTFRKAFKGKKFNLGIVLCLTLMVFATTVYAEDVPSAKNETTGVVYTDLQTAINDASANDTIKIHGTFTGNFTILNNVILKGRSGSILDGNQTGPVLIIGNSSSVTVELNKLKIRNGNNVFGGGITNSANLILNNVEIEKNTATDSGGGIYNSPTAVLTIINSKIKDNTAGNNGGGIENIGGTLTIQNSEILSNNSVNYGAGVYNSGSIAATLTKSKIKNNISSNGVGGGFYTLNSLVTLDNVKIENNQALLGGGYLNDGTSVSNFYKSILYKNSAIYVGGGIYVDGGSANFTLSKISRNSSPDGGGGIFIIGSALLYLGATKVDHNSPNDITFY
jgi:predicted outer membrane repeat protein